MKTRNQPTQEATLLEIAKTTLHLETLEERMSDSLDFHDLNIVEIREALRRAFEAGRESVSS